jgi:transposase InsO family protein
MLVSVLDMLALIVPPFHSTLGNNFAGRAVLKLELVALRHQLAVSERISARPVLQPADRLLWVILSRILPTWHDALVIVKPDTVVDWRRKGFRLVRTWKSRRRSGGRPLISREFRELIRRTSHDNPLWGAPRIPGELLKLSIDVSQTTVSKYMINTHRTPLQTWQTFMRNHMDCLASMDFFVLPTTPFWLLLEFVILRHERRRIVHFAVSAHPTAIWIKQQITGAFPWDTAEGHPIRDRDSKYAPVISARIEARGIEEVVAAPRSPWQNSFVEPVVGSIRTERLDHMIVLNENHPRKILVSYLD